MNDATSKSFDLEQKILSCWNIIDDLNVIYEAVMEQDGMSKDDIANMLLGLKTLYDLRFSQTFNQFETLHSAVCATSRQIEDAEIARGIEDAEIARGMSVLYGDSSSPKKEKKSKKNRD